MRCPKCNHAMSIRQFTELTNGKHDDEDSRDPYCPSCKVRWIALKVDEAMLNNSLPAKALDW